MENIDQIAEFIKSWEGCLLTPRPDGVNGACVIGWGMDSYPNGVPVKITDAPITQEQADSMFLELLAPYFEGVCEAVGASISSQINKLVPLVDFAYNLGLGAFKQSTLLQHVMAGMVVESDFTIYDHVGTQVDAGLLARRKAEYELFIKPINEIKTMEPTNVTQETPQVLTVSQIAVTYKTFVNGEVTEDSRTVDVTVTPELCAALKASSLVAPGWNIDVVPQE